MADQITVNIDQIGREWGALLTQAFVRIAQLEAQVARHQENEAKLLARIEALEDELDRLRVGQPATWGVNKKAAPVDG